MEIYAIGAIFIFCIFYVIVPFFTPGPKVFEWVVYRRHSTYRIAYLDSMHERIYISKYHEANGSVYETYLKEEACQMAGMLNSIERMNIADAKADKWKQVNC